MKILKQILVGILTVGALIFAAQNFDAVQIRFLSWSVQLPIAVVVFGIYVLGAVSGGLLLSLFKKVATMGDKVPEKRSSDSADRSRDESGQNRTFF